MRIINNQLSIINQKGTALLVVLFIVMAITILSLGFLSRSDVELACGENMILKTKMDYLAESGLEHAKDLSSIRRMCPMNTGQVMWNSSWLQVVMIIMTSM